MLATETDTNTRQATIDRFGVHEYERGDLLERRESGRSTKLLLTECPICAADPQRPRYHFREHESRPKHFRESH